MNIVVLTSKHHFYANKIIKFLIKNFPEDIKLVIESDSIIPGSSKLSALMRYFSISGFQYVFCQILKQYIFNFFSFLSHLFHRKNFYYSYKQVFNKIENWEKLKKGEKLIKRIKKENPDLIISVFSKHFLRNDILRLSKMAVNIHPSFLPFYRGVSPTFWVLAEKEEKTGVSLHKMSLKTDAGEIISQREIEISQNDTEHSLYLKCVDKGEELLKGFIQSYKNCSVCAITKQQRKGSYFSLPTKKGVNNFKKNNRKFFTFSEIISIF